MMADASRQIADTTHKCPRNGCFTRVPRSQFACRTHWYTLTLTARQRINTAYRSRNWAEHRAAMLDAIDELNAPHELVDGGRGPELVRLPPGNRALSHEDAKHLIEETP